MDAERWSRNCGSGGVGQSGHITTYRSGVKILNWVEDDAKGFGAPHAETILTHTGRQQWPPNTTQRTYFTEQGKTGEALLEASARQDAQVSPAKKEILLRHGRFDAPPLACYATTYGLTHGREDGSDRRPEAYLWHGRKQNDLYVPTTTQNTLPLTTRKVHEWGGQDSHDPYLTTQKATAQPAALATAASPSRTQTLPPLSDSGMVTQPGQRPKGPARDECDKSYRGMGLRVEYGTGKA